MKTCNDCKKSLQEDSFCKHKNMKDGLSRTCRLCMSMRAYSLRERKREELNQRGRDYYRANKDKVLKRTSAYQKSHRNQSAAWTRKSRQKLKQEVLSFYSNGLMKCNHCVENEVQVLTIDHINGGGGKHREELFGDSSEGGSVFYVWLKQNDYPEGFQVLCFNCQYKKRPFDWRGTEEFTESQVYKHNHNLRQKRECLSHYGGFECPECGEDHILALTLDHVNNDGNKHREILRNNKTTLYTHLKNNNYPNDPPLQVFGAESPYIVDAWSQSE